MQWAVFEPNGETALGPGAPGGRGLSVQPMAQRRAAGAASPRRPTLSAVTVHDHDARRPGRRAPDRAGGVVVKPAEFVIFRVASSRRRPYPERPAHPPPFAMRAMFSLLGLLIVAAIVLVLVKQQLGGFKAPGGSKTGGAASSVTSSGPGSGPAGTLTASPRLWASKCRARWTKRQGAPPRRRRRRGIDQAKTARQLAHAHGRRALGLVVDGDVAAVASFTGGPTTRPRPGGFPGSGPACARTRRTWPRHPSAEGAVLAGAGSNGRPVGYKSAAAEAGLGDGRQPGMQTQAMRAPRLEDGGELGRQPLWSAPDGHHAVRQRGKRGEQSVQPLQPSDMRRRS